MAEVHFFMTHRDTHAFATFLIESFDATFILDQHGTAELPVFDTVEEIDHAVQRDFYAPRFFVLSPDWERYPLPVSEIHHQDGRHLFYVEQRYGGPAFDFIVSRHDVSTGRIYPGYFSDYPWYYRCPGDARTFNRPKLMADAYRDVQRYLAREGRRSRCRETQRTGPFILPDARAAYDKGTWLRQGDWHFEPK